jgi:hypothetical protein
MAFDLLIKRKSAVANNLIARASGVAGIPQVNQFRAHLFLFRQM